MRGVMRSKNYSRRRGETVNELSRELVEKTFSDLRVLARLKGHWGEGSLAVIDTLRDQALRATPPGSQGIRELCVKLLRKYPLEEAKEIVRQIQAHGMKPDSEAERLLKHALDCNVSVRDPQWHDDTRAFLSRQPAAREPEGLELARWIINRQGLPDTLNKSSDEVIAIYQAEMLRASEPTEGGA